MKKPEEPKRELRFAKAAVLILNGAAMIMLFWSVVNGGSHFFFATLRWICFAALVQSAFYVWKVNVRYYSLICLAFALAFNPFLPIHLSRSVWQGIDTLAFFVLFFPCVFVVDDAKTD